MVLCKANRSMSQAYDKSFFIKRRGKPCGCPYRILFRATTTDTPYVSQSQSLLLLDRFQPINSIQNDHSKQIMQNDLIQPPGANAP